MNPLLRIALACIGMLAVGDFQPKRSFAAGPTSESPQTFMALWSDESTAPTPGEILSRALKLYEGLPKAVEKFEASIKEDKADRLKRMEVGRTKFTVEYLDHLAVLLEAWGEPAGFDLHRRSGELAVRMSRVYTAVMSAPESASQINPTKVQQYAKKNEKKLPHVNKLIEEGKFDAAAKVLLPVYVELASAGCWYEYNQRRAMMELFDLAYNRLTTTQVSVNKRLARETAAALARQAHPGFEQLTTELAAVNISNDGMGTWGGKSLTGPRLAAAMFASLQTTCGQTLRAHAMEFVSVELGEVPPNAKKLLAAYNAYSTATVDAVRTLIEADAARATADEAAQLHAGYLASICGHAARLGGTSSVEPLAEALDKLAAKSASLAADASAYRGATSDWLRWRNRATVAAIKAQTGKSPPFELKSKGPIASLDLPAPELIGTAMKRLGSQPLAAEAGLLATADKTRCSQPIGAVVLRIAESAINVEAILGSDLLISKGKGPLTLEVGLAYARARRGDLAAAGGKLQSIELIGSIPLQAGDTPERSAIFPADSVTSANAVLAATRADQVIYLVTLTPDWIAGEHYFVNGELGSN